MSDSLHPPSPERLSLNQITLNRYSLPECVDLCVKHGLKWIGPWRNKVAETGLNESARIIREAGLKVSGLCRGGYFPAPTAADRQKQIEDNLRAIDEAATLGTNTLVLVCGPAPDRDIDAARGMVADGIAAIVNRARSAKVKLAIEPLHPMFAADRSVICLVDEALTLAQKFDGADVGLALDAFHIWWDPYVYEKLKKCTGRILTWHVSDWAVPLPGIFAARSMMGSGVIELRRLRHAVEEAGYTGPIEVEIMNEAIWARPGGDVLEEMKKTFAEHV
jgi:sugar phosphate isomerase/epimerase